MSKNQILSKLQEPCHESQLRSDVLGSHDGLAGGGCLPYARKTHEKQKWLEKYLHHWRALGRDRNKAMPHIKVRRDAEPGICHTHLYVRFILIKKYSHTRESAMTARRPATSY